MWLIPLQQCKLLIELDAHPWLPTKMKRRAKAKTTANPTPSFRALMCCVFFFSFSFSFSIVQARRNEIPLGRK